MEISISEIINNFSKKDFWILSAKIFIQSFKIYLQENKTLNKNLTIRELIKLMFEHPKCKFIITPLYMRYINSGPDDGGIFLLNTLIAYMIEQDNELINLLNKQS